MLIRLKKGAGEEYALTFVRDDGSRTWSRVSPYLVQHDLLHYAVESALGMTEAFLGLVANGRDPSDFEKGGANRLPVEARQAETIVAVMQAEPFGSLDPAELPRALAQASAAQGVPLPSALTDDALERIRRLHSRLLRGWASLEPGRSMELPWPAGPSELD